MNVTKYLHSCLLIEDQDKVILMDPGNYTYDAKVLPLDSLTKLDYVLITHEHMDHFSLPLVKDVVAKFPAVTIIAPSSVVEQLAKENIKATNQPTTDVTFTDASHEEVLMFPIPENYLFTVFNKLSHPGDSYHFSQTAEVLAMPMTAPWGSMVEALRKIIELKPKVVIPIHDWHWKDEAKTGFYPRVADFLKQQEIEFKIIATGEVIEI